MTETPAQTLDVVTREVGAALALARQSLEAHVEQAGTPGSLERCAEALHEVCGVLRVVEVYGAALLAEEMELAARFLVDCPPGSRPHTEGLEALMRSLMQLPAYVERVLGGGRDLTLVLLPLLNDLRAVRGSPLLSEGTLLVLNLSSDRQAEPHEPAPGEPALDAQQWARRLRTRFQVGLLGWIRGENPAQNLEALAQVAEKLEQVATLQPVFQFWWVVGAVIEALRDGGLEASATPKRLLGQADRELKRLYEEGEARYAESPPLELLNNLLYYVAHTSTAGPRVEAVRTSFKLQELLPVSAAVEREREHLAAPSTALMRTVGAAIREDLARIKDVLDIFVRKGASDLTELVPQVELLRKVSDTLGVLDLGALRARVRAEVARLDDIAQGRLPPTDRVLVEVAATLIGVEDGLDEALVSLVTPGEEEVAAEEAHDGHDAEVHRVQAATLRECIVNLARIKEAVAAAIAGHPVASAESVDELARGIRAALWLLDRERARDLMTVLAQEVQAVLLAGEPVPAARLDRLADAMVSIEYYMETLEAGRTDPSYMLDNAAACLAALAAPELPVAAQLVAQGFEVAPPAPTAPAATSGLPYSSTVVLPRAAAERAALESQPAVASSPGIAAPATAEPAPSPTPPPVHDATVPDLAAALAAEIGEEPAAAPGSLLTQRMPAATPSLDPHVDPDLVELFIQEARDEVAVIERAFPRWADNPADLESLVRIRRAFHTLKGSGRMVGARAVSEYAWVAESLLNRVLNGTLSRSPEMVDVLREAVHQLPLLVEQLAGGGELPEATGWAAARLQALTEGRELATVKLPMTLEAGAPRPPGAPVIVTPLTRARDAEWAAAVAAAASTVDAAPEVAEQSSPVPAPALETEPLPEPMPELLPEPMPQLLPEPAPEAMPAAQSGVSPDAEPAPPSFVDLQLAEIYRAETASHLAAIRSFLRECVGHAPPHRVTEALHRACHTLAGASKMAEVPAGVRLAEPLNLYLRKLHDHGLGLSRDGLEVLADVADAMEQVAATFAEPSAPSAPHDALLGRLDDLRLLLDLEIAAEALPPPPAELPLPPESPPPESPPPEPPPPAPPAITPATAAVDLEIAAVFAEEAKELLEFADAALLAWRANPSSIEAPAALKRALHTLKGGARMAGLLEMGTLGHEAESLLERAEGPGHPMGSSGSASLLDLLQATLDHLAAQRDGLLAGRLETAGTELLARIRTAILASPAPSVVTLPPAAVTPEISPVMVPAPAAVSAATPSFAAPAALTTEAPPVVTPAPAAAESVPPSAVEPASPVEPRELARVDAELLDELLNHAGEVSILRARLEQQWNSVEANLAELSRVTTRLKEQLRRLELETEAQILARHETDTHRGAFDPLELDRYSSLHQYSRALAESAADVASLQSLLEQQTRDGQNLLMQQARSVSELQNGLMRSRMIAFQRHVPRLSRLVRQVAAQTGKRAELVVTGASGELDRQVLERLIGPFEHLLRNAVVHGIESPADRERAGKPAEGRIEVALHRENAEMVITVADDGAGLDLSVIRERARARGLVPAGAVLTDSQAMQLVLEPGFSTAREVTAEAGRGVGMDVVATAVKKLGGSLQMASVSGRGARFTLRLPFTLAISQALVVRTADELYALPLPTVEAVVRLPRQEVMRHLAAAAATYDYGGQSYRFDHLARYLGAPLAQLPEQEAAVPVVLVRAGERSAALVIDELLGNREVVVKPVGPQVSAIEGISGATILGDGRVVLLLDLPSLVRAGAPAGESPTAERQDRRVHALVVDDSITVRRVTQRLLERHGMRVSTARDGIDALTVLQDHVPDIVLLDIEMPRMDGYELAAHLRADVRLREVPIVMITSRVGEKHRAKAIELGVDDYLGKPYQESQLLDAIEPLLARRTPGWSH